jgi:hypothetical protein
MSAQEKDRNRHLCHVEYYRTKQKEQQPVPSQEQKPLSTKSRET